MKQIELNYTVVDGDIKIILYAFSGGVSKIGGFGGIDLVEIKYINYDIKHFTLGKMELNMDHPMDLVIANAILKKHKIDLTEVVYKLTAPGR